MKISKKTVAAGTIGAVAASGLGLVLLGAPLASAATTDSSTGTSTAAPASSDRLQGIKDALAGLVSDGTLTQTQADTVASTLDSSDALRGGSRGAGGPGVSLEAAATAIGLSAEDLQAALQAEGATLAGVAAEHDVAKQTLIDALVAAATQRLQQNVTDGRLTQQQADERIAALPERIATAVDSTSTDALAGRGGRGGPSATPDGDTTDSSDSSSDQESSSTGTAA